MRWGRKAQRIWGCTTTLASICFLLGEVGQERESREGRRDEKGEVPPLLLTRCPC
jgi:hypothetical protein